MATGKCLTVMVHVHSPELHAFGEKDFERLFQTQLENLVGFSVENIMVLDADRALEGLIAVLDLGPPVDGNGKRKWLPI